MSKEESEEVTEVIAQVVGHKNLKMAGGLRVELDIPDALEKDICYFTLLSIKKAHVKLKVLPYAKEEHEEGKEGKSQGFGRFRDDA